MKADAVRQLTFAEAVNEGLAAALEQDPSVYVIGLGVPDPKGIFGTTTGLQARFGEKRVFDMPIAENAVTGIVLGSAIDGMRPVMTHQRIDFALHALEQIVNQAAKWHYMFDGRMRAPMVIRMIVGRGWGQGPQHSQSLHGWFSHIPGLKVVMPALPADAKELLIAAIQDDNPVIFIEHRWLYGIRGPVPAGYTGGALGGPRVVRPGDSITIVASGYMTVESLRAADLLATCGIDAEVIDIQMLNPLDDAPIIESVRRTGRLLVADCGWTHCGYAGEIAARATEKAYDALSAAPRRVALPDCPTPTSPALTEDWYPVATDIAAAAAEILEVPRSKLPAADAAGVPHDIPDTRFTGPF
jgi:pyruvate dehydrogenase E1 component beta subunit